ncbi:OmpA family protein [Pseudomonas sp. JQ170]|uniref:OmpA family protein n=1 Tax=Pseudomonas sp. JQ170 TaxID=2828861 RepID=UPI003462A3AA
MPATPLPSGYAGTYDLADSGQVSKPFARYQITTQEGGVFKGVTDRHGQTMSVHTLLPGAMTIAFPEATGFDEQLRLLGRSGEIASHVKYSATLADGSSIEGVTDALGLTERIVTKEAVQITRLTLFPPEQAELMCCAAQNTQSPLVIDLTDSDIVTNEEEVGHSSLTVKLPKGKKRGLTPGEIDMARTVLPALVTLNTALARLNAALEGQVQAPLLTLQALRHQVASFIQRVQRMSPIGEALPVATNLPEPTLVRPVVILPPTRLPPLTPRKRKTGLWLCALGALLVSSSAAWWWERARSFEPPPVPAPVQLDSLQLFEAGSAALTPGSTKVLINALVDIKARPGWLIVISGHTDTTGNAGQNLALSHTRATAVRDWMQRMGDIPDNCFAVQGGAANQPIASNETLEGRSANRRVDIQLVPHEGACG